MISEGGTPVESAELGLLLGALSNQLGMSLTLISLNGECLHDTRGIGAGQHFLIRCWPRLISAVTFQPTDSAQEHSCERHRHLAARFDIGRRELALVSSPLFPATEAHLAVAVAQADQVSADRADAATSFSRVALVVRRYLQGCWSDDQELVTRLVESALGDEDQADTGSPEQRLVELAMHAPRVSFAIALQVTDQRTVRLAARQGKLPVDFPLELPISGLWGKSLVDGQMRFVINPAEDPGFPLAWAESVADFSIAYLPISAGGAVVLILLVGLAGADALLSPELRRLLRWFSRHATMRLARHLVEQENCRLRRQRNVAQQLMGSLVADTLPEVLTSIASSLRGFLGLSWARVQLATAADRPPAEEVVTVPLRQGARVLGSLQVLERERSLWSVPEFDECVEFASVVIALLGRGGGAAAPGADQELLRAALSPREIEVFWLVAKGEPNKAVARILAISEKTVKTHVSSILRKLQLPDRTGVAIWASQLANR